MSIAGTRIGQFTAVDGTQEAARLIAFLEWIEYLPQSMALRQRSYDLMNIQAQNSVADIGCGTGCAVAELSSRSAVSTGIDISEKMISIAHQRFPSHHFQIAPAEHLPFANNSLDAYRAERLYQHLLNPAIALSEAQRVLRPGGRIVLIDLDYDMWVVDSDDEAQTRIMMRALADSIASHWIGRRYRNLLLDGGFSEVNIEVQTLIYTDYAQVAPILPSIANAGVATGAVTAAQVQVWLAEQVQRGQANRFFLALPLFVASARRV